METPATPPIPTVAVGGGKWAHEYWVPFLHDQPHLVVTSVVDLDPAAASAMAARFPGAVPFASLRAAVAANAGLEVVLVLSGPESHADLLLEAHELGLDAISEKPVAMNEAALSRLAALGPSFFAVVTQNYRYEAGMQTLRQVLQSGSLGPVRTIHVRFAADYRVRGAWDVGDAHSMAHPMLLEGSVHHFDLMRYLVGADIARVVASSHNPPASSFDGDALVHCLLEFENGALGTYEASLLCAGKENRWHHEHYRVECEAGSVECDGWGVRTSRGHQVENVELMGDPSARDGHRTVLEQFVAWRRGGPVAETALHSNVRSMAAVLAAVRSVESGSWVDVAAVGTSSSTGL